MDNYVTLGPSTCLLLNSQTLKICLPPKEICLDQPVDGIIANCDDRWNCTHCASDSDYNIPYLRGDKIQILSTLFDGYNANPEIPVNGFGNFIVAEFCGDVIGTTTDLSLFASRSMVAYGCGRSYQIIEVDTSLFTDCNWYINIKTFDVATNEIQSVCTQEFGEVSDKKPTMLIKGEGLTSDCFNSCYGLPDNYVGDLIEYDNTLRIHGYVKASDIAVEKTVIQGRTSRSVIEDRYTLQLGSLIPPFMHRVLVKQLLSGDTVTIDGEEYLTPESFSTANDIEKGYMFLYAVTLTKECDSGGSCS